MRATIVIMYTPGVDAKMFDGATVTADSAFTAPGALFAIEVGETLRIRRQESKRYVMSVKRELKAAGFAVTVQEVMR